VHKSFVSTSLNIISIAVACLISSILRGGPLEIPGGGGVKIPPKKFVQRKMPGKKFVQPLRQRKKNRASKQQSTNSLEKNSCRGKCIKKNPAET
jgi:hypothetical protein